MCRKWLEQQAKDADIELDDLLEESSDDDDEGSKKKGGEDISAMREKLKALMATNMTTNAGT